MKKNIIKFRIVLMALMVFPLSCNTDDLLNQVNPNQISTDSFWQTEDDVQKAIIANYSPMSAIFGWGRYLPFTWLRRADEYTPGFNNPFTEGIMTNPSDIFLPNQWPEAWKVIFRSNEIFDNIDRVEGLSSTFKDQALGQAHFLRALYYFYLVNTWDNVPLITTAAVTSDDFFAANSTPDAIYPLIISDAQMAKSLLPNNWGDKNGRATWGAATALLGKAYLYRGEWASAAAEFKELIDSGIYALDPNYANNFTEEGDNNIESLFEVQFESEPSLVWSTDAPDSSRSSVFLDFRSPKPGIWIDQVNPWILDAFLMENDLDGNIDPRALITLAWNHPESTVFLGEPFTGSDLAQDKIHPKKLTGMLVPGRADDLDLGIGGGVNYKLIRYADVLLMYAEAANEANLSESDILSAINEVRARVNMPNVPSGLSQADMRNRIRLERILELSLETDRFFDLKRWGVLVDRMNKNADMFGNIGPSSDQIRAAGHPEENFPFSEIHTRAPIPIAEINSNPNMKQNPGY